MATTLVPCYSKASVLSEPQNSQIVKSHYNLTRILDNNAFSLDKLKMNKVKLKSFKLLPENWNNCEGEQIGDDVIEIANNILSSLTIQPQVFPTGGGGIQIEKYFSDDTFYEIEIGKDSISAYLVKGANEFENDVRKEEIVPLLSTFFQI